MRIESSDNDLRSMDGIKERPGLYVDLIQSMLGVHIGSGETRTVYEYALDPEYVIKVEPVMHGHNISEYDLWKFFGQADDYEKWVLDWFAPVKWISPGGHLLCMKRTNPGVGEHWPEKIPKFMSDLHKNNFGFIDDQFVCHDYAYLKEFIYSEKMQKVKWK